MKLTMLDKKNEVLPMTAGKMTNIKDHAMRFILLEKTLPNSSRVDFKKMGHEGT